MSALPRPPAVAELYPVPPAPAPATILQVRTVRFAVPLGSRPTAEVVAAGDAAVNAAIRHLAARGEEVVSVQATQPVARAGPAGGWYEVAYAVVVRAPLAGAAP